MEFQSSQQSLVWFRDQYREGALEIKPPFQRRPVWQARQKCSLIESILLGLPVPEIYIQQTVSNDDKAHYAIVDGQQRIRTVLQFIGADKDPDEQEYNKFALDKLNDEAKYKNITFAELNEEDRKRFLIYQFAVRFLLTEKEVEVRDMFRRLNKFLTPLNEQELRNALFSGPFIVLASKLADKEYWADIKIFTPALIRRMKDVEFMSELLIGILHGPQGGSPKYVNPYYEKYEDYEDEFPDQRHAKKLFNETLLFISSTLPNIQKTRWANRTDFYTLFVAVAAMLKSRAFLRQKATALRKALEGFADEVSQRLSDEKTSVSDNAVSYVRAVEKGANDKKRRANRHIALLSVIEPFFK